MTNFVGGVQLPPVSQEFIEQLETAFPTPRIVPGMDRDDAMYKSGCAYVVEWIKTHAAVKGKNDPVAAQRAVVRYGGDT